MLKKMNLNLIQISGLILCLIGLTFVAFPTGIGIVAIRIITFLFLLIGIYGAVFASVVKSKLTTLSSLMILMVGIYTFVHPDQILFFFGVACIISGINGLILNIKNHQALVERTIISSVLLLLLGVFAIVNTKAALETIITILGLLVVVIGFILFFIGERFRIIKVNHSTVRKSQSTRIVIPIDSDDADEIDFKDL